MFVQQSRMKPEYPLEKKQISLLHLQLSALFKPKERNELWINWFPIAPLSDLCVFWRETAEMSRGNLSEACGQKRVVRRALSHFSEFCFVLLVYPPSVAFSLSSNCMRSQPPSLRSSTYPGLQKRESGQQIGQFVCQLLAPGIDWIKLRPCGRGIIL